MGLESVYETGFIEECKEVIEESKIITKKEPMERGEMVC